LTFTLQKPSPAACGQYHPPNFDGRIGGVGREKIEWHATELDTIRHSDKTRKGNRCLRQALVEMTHAAVKTKGTYPVER
jgi:hypothetical protein